MKFVSIDIETTGLDPERDEILAVGLVACSTSSTLPVVQQPHLEVRVLHDRIEGDIVALGMNADLIRDIANQTPIPHTPYVQKDRVAEVVWDFIQTNTDIGAVVNLCGKNIGTFDLKFLSKLPGWGKVKHHRRFLDVGPMFATEADEVVPGLRECLERVNDDFKADHGVYGMTPHRALEDAMMTAVVALAGLNRNTK